MRAKRSSLSIPYKAGTPEYQREWKKLNPKTYTDAEKKAKRENSRKRRYGVTPDQFAIRLAEQQCQCAICKTDIGISAHVDHNHETGDVRGLLCSNCNRAIGLLKDNPTLLREAAHYLELNGTKTI